MSVGWESLPLLPLRSVLEHLSLTDALSAMSVCRNWRNGLLMYEGNREELKVQTKPIEKSLFLARLFRKNVKNLQVYINCVGEELDRFFNIVMPEFYDSVKLEDILFIGQYFLEHNHNLTPARLNRVVTEGLVYKNSCCISTLGIFGCEMDAAIDSDRYINEQIEYYAAPLSFDEEPSVADSVLSHNNVNHMLFSTLQHIAVDYDTISTEALETLSHLPMFSHLSLIVTNRRHSLQPIDWHHIAPCYPNGLDVSVNIIALPLRRFPEVIENVLVEGMCLVSLKVFFCKTLYAGLLTHAVRYKSTLREVVWADCPADTADPIHRVVRNIDQIDACNVNPFVLLCWQCKNLRRLAIHGYWIWQYDILGFVRLRKTLEHLEISAIYNKQSRFNSALGLTPDCALRVLARDAPPYVHRQYVQRVNELTQFEWSPIQWSSLHPALHARSPAGERTLYITSEVMRPVPPPVDVL